MKRTLKIIILTAFVMLPSYLYGQITYYTYQSGDFTSANIWTTDQTGTTLVGSATPVATDNIVILNGVSITCTTDFTVASCIINLGGTLDLGNIFDSVTDGSLGTVSGQGLLRINGNIFPSGSFTGFVSLTGGTVEFYNTGGLISVTQTTFNNLKITNSSSTNYTLEFDTNVSMNGEFNLSRTGSGSISLNIGTSTSAAARTITFNKNINVGTGCILGVGTANLTHFATVRGDIINNGIIDFFNSGTIGVNVTFSGSTNNTVLCDGQTDFYRIIVNKGTDQTYGITINSTSISNFTLNSNGAVGATPKVTLTTGFLSLKGKIDVSNWRSGAGNSFTIPFAAKLIIDDPGVTVSVMGTGQVINLDGTLQINDGVFYSAPLGTNSGIWLDYTGQLIINNGSIYCSQIKIAPTGSGGSYQQYGGTVNIAGTSGVAYPRFHFPNPNMTFIMTGGLLNISVPNLGTPNAAAGGAIYISVPAINYTVSGGSCTVSYDSRLNNNCIINSSVPFYNLTVNRTGASAGTGVCFLGNAVEDLEPDGTANTTYTAQPLTILNDFILNTGNNTSFNANGQNITIGRNLTINPSTTFTTGNNTTTFNGNSNQVITLNNSSPSFYNLNVSGTGAVNFSGNTPVINNNLNINSGSFDDNGMDISVSGNISNSGNHIGTGRIIMAGSASSQTIDGTNGVFQNLRIGGSASSKTIIVTGNQTINGDLDISQGATSRILDIGSNHLVFGENSTIIGYSGVGPRLIVTSGLSSNAGVTRNYSSTGGSFVFPIGVGSKYSPATINITNAGGVAGTVTVNPVNSEHPSVSSNGIALSFYWKVTSTGFNNPTVTHTYQYDQLDATGYGDETEYVPARFTISDGQWASGLSSEVDENTNTFLFSGVSFLNGDFTAGDDNPINPFTSPATYYSIASGAWENVNNWSFSSGGAVAGSIPNSSSIAIIESGFNINISSSKTVSALTLNGTLDLGSISGSNFNLVSGTGIIRISTNSFPAGDISSFLQSGTVEYYYASSNFTIPVSQTSYNNLIISSGTGQITFPDINLTINGNLSINGTTGQTLISNTTNGNLNILGDLSINGGILRYQNTTARSVSVSGNVIVVGTFDVSALGGTPLNTLSIGGSLTNNGTFDMSNTGICDVTFTGTGNTSISGTGATTDFNRLIVNKGTTWVPVLDVNSNSFTLSATTQGATKALEIQNGTFRLTSNQTIVLSSGASIASNDFVIPATGRLWVNGGTAQIQATGTNAGLLLYGKLQISNGSAEISAASSSDNYIQYGINGSEIEINGGTLIVGSEIRRSTTISIGYLIYTQTGGNVTIGRWLRPNGTVRGMLEILNSNSSFTMSNGTITIIRIPAGTSTFPDLYLQPSVSNVSGGTIYFGSTVYDPGANRTLLMNSTAVLFNLEIQRIAARTTTVQIVGNNITASGNITINTGCTLNTSNLNVTVGGNMSISGTYTPGTNTTIFNGTSQQITASSSFYNLTLGNNNSVTLNNAITVSSNLSIGNSSTLNTGTNILSVAGNISNTGSIDGTGIGAVSLTGASQQTLSGGGSYRSLSLTGVGGAILGSNLTLSSSGVLTFGGSSGSLNISTFSLTILNPSLTSIAGSSSARYIISAGSFGDGGVTKTFSGSTNGTFTWPVGVNGRYTPSSYSINTGLVGGTVTLKPINLKHSNASGAGADYINYYWNVTNNIVNLNSLTHTYTWVASVESGNNANYSDARFIGSLWNLGTTANVNTGTRTVTFTNVNLTGDYTAGNNTGLFQNPATYTSISNGTWETDSNWNPDPGTLSGPPAGSNIVVNHIITVTQNNKSALSMVLGNSGVLNLGQTIAHSFGTVSGNGRINIGSSIFPAGIYTSFLSTGTVEYSSNSDITFPTNISQYNNIIVSGNGIKNIGNLNLSISGNLTISNNSTFQLSPSFPSQQITLTGDFNNDGTFNPQTGTVILNNPTAKSIVSNAGGTNLYNLTLNGSGATSIQSGGVSVSNNFVWSGGVISTSNNGELILSSPADQIGLLANYNSSKMINGRVSVRFPPNVYSSRNFPTGAAGAYRPVTVTGTAITLSSIIRVQTISGDLFPTANYSGGLVNISHVRYYEIDNTNGSSLLNPTISLEIQADEGANDSEGLVIGRSTDLVNWSNQGGAFNGTLPNGTVTSDSSLTVLDPINYFLVASTTIDNSLPVTLSESSMKLFSTRNGIEFKWITESELNNNFWLIERAVKGSDDFVSVGKIAGKGTISEKSSYSFLDHSVIVGKTYKYRLVDYDYSGKRFEHHVMEVDHILPTEFMLGKNYPNPFNPQTSILVDIAKEQHVSLIVYNLLGQKIRTLKNEIMKPNYYKIVWDGKNENGLPVASGQYLIRFETKGFVQTNKMLLVK